jgi:hypothetical protein
VALTTSMFIRKCACLKGFVYSVISATLAGVLNLLDE